MEFRILGPLEVCRDGDPLPIRRAKPRALLALLLLHANEGLSSERLIDELWGEHAPATAAKALQVYVSQLRKLLEPQRAAHEPGLLLERTAAGYRLHVKPGQLDLHRFEEYLEQGREALAEGDPAKAERLLASALTLWRGPPLADLTYEAFAQTEIARLEELRLTALEERIEAGLQLGRHREVIPELEALVAQHPLRERPRGRLMLALYRSGRQAEALQAYRDARQALVDELGIEPSQALRELEQAILRQDPALQAPDEAAPPVARQKPPQAPAPAEPRAPSEERKVVSVLFVDLVRSEAPAGSSDPEDVRSALEPFHTAARSVIERHGGTIEDLVGNAVLAVFGAPTVHEDDPERAVRAALALRDWVAREERDLQLRMGVSTGIALVSGSTVAAGELVEEARRLTALGGVVVGEQTYLVTRQAIDYRPANLADGWEAVGASSRLGVDLLREPKTPLVGRRRELDLLVSALARAREERMPQLVTLVGVPGIGKSRLVFELAKVVDEDQELITWRQGRCLPYGDGVSFWALGEIVKEQAGILESDSPEQASHKLGEAVLNVVAEEHEAAWVEQQLRALVGAGGELAPGEPSGEAFAAWRRFLAGLAERRPSVLVFEDLHWADEGLLDFVDELADRSRDAPLLILCTARPELLERRSGWGGGKVNALTISIRPLSDEDTGRIVAGVLEQPLLEAGLEERLVARASGNPLYAEQFARVVAELGSLEELPETVHGIIAARLDGLLPAEKALLQDAAVVGKVFWLGALEAVGDGSRLQLEQLLRGLERMEFVQQARRSSVADEAEYAFRHVLLRDVAYGQIPRAGRRDKHRAAGAWIESLGRPDDHAEMLAYHYLSALQYARASGQEEPALTERARLALRAAGDRALALASYAAAARYYSTALELWPDDPERVWLLVHSARASYAADGTGINLLEQAFEELRSGGDADGAAEVAVDLARCLWFGGDRDAAYSYVDHALDLAAGRADSKARAHALVHRAAYHMIASEHHDAVVLASEALPLAEALGLDDLSVRPLDVLGAARALSGDVGGLDDSRQAIARARETNAFSHLLSAEVNLYMSHIVLGQLADASETARMLQRDVQSYGTRMIERFVSSIEAYEAVLHGRWDDASELLDQRISEVEAGSAHYLEPAWRALRASIELARGHLERASLDSQQAVAGARRTKDPQVLAPALSARGIVLVAQDRAKDATRGALEVLELGSMPLIALQEVPAATPIEFAWLLYDLDRQDELVSALESAPTTPWLDAARAIAQSEFADAIGLVTRIGAPSVEAYTRLRVAEQLAWDGRQEQAADLLAPALAFFRKVGAKRYLAQAEKLQPR